MFDHMSCICWFPPKFGHFGLHSNRARTRSGGNPNRDSNSLRSRANGCVWTLIMRSQALTFQCIFRVISDLILFKLPSFVIDIVQSSGTDWTRSQYTQHRTSTLYFNKWLLKAVRIVFYFIYFFFFTTYTNLLAYFVSRHVALFKSYLIVWHMSNLANNKISSVFILVGVRVWSLPFCYCF